MASHCFDCEGSRRIFINMNTIDKDWENYSASNKNISIQMEYRFHLLNNFLILPSIKINFLFVIIHQTLYNYKKFLIGYNQNTVLVYFPVHKTSYTYSNHSTPFCWMWSAHQLCKWSNISINHFQISWLIQWTLMLMIPSRQRKVLGTMLKTFRLSLFKLGGLRGTESCQPMTITSRYGCGQWNEMKV